MENTTNNEIKVTSHFCGDAPLQLKVAYSAVALSAAVQYRTDVNTGETSLCMLVPCDKGVQPAIVTFKQDDCMGKAAYEGFYHQVGLEKLLETENMNDIDFNKYLIEQNVVLKKLGNGNNYLSEIHVPKYNELRDCTMKNYPEYVVTLDECEKSFEGIFNEKFKTGNALNNIAANNDTEEKKTTPAAVMGQPDPTTTSSISY